MKEVWGKFSDGIARMKILNAGILLHVKIFLVFKQISSILWYNYGNSIMSYIINKLSGYYEIVCVQKYFHVTHIHCEPRHL